MDTAALQTDVELPDGLPQWLGAFVTVALRETETLRENGADQAATARLALIQRLLAAATTWLDTDIDVAEAAREVGVCEETIRRAVRRGDVPDRRPDGRGRHRIRRRDLDRVAACLDGSYDPVADAQDIARLRRKL